MERVMKGLVVVERREGEGEMREVVEGVEEGKVVEKLREGGWKEWVLGLGVWEEMVVDGLEGGLVRMVG